MATLLGGMSGKAEKAIRDRKSQLDDQESKILDTKYDEKKNKDAADGKTRLTTDDKKYK
jgi:hypothetical protein